jgi:predicted transglutaminase-like cysteine proteinase
MGYFDNRPTWRAFVLACGLAWFGPAAEVTAGALIAPGTLELIRKSAEPFGLSVTQLSAGGLREKWMNVERKLDDEGVQLALCDGDREGCVSPAALQFLAIVDAARAKQGRAQLGEINRAINLAIKPMSDMAQHGKIDVWSSPLDTFASGAGDCEDYAIAKFVALRMAGVPTQDIRIVILRDLLRGEDHAVTLARLDEHWFALDNRRMTMVEDSDIRNHRPLFVLNDRGAMRYENPLTVDFVRQESAATIAADLTIPMRPASTSK